MGAHSSSMKVRVEVSLPEGSCRVDAITLSYSSGGCWGRGRRRLGKFTFPRQGWVCGEEVQLCAAKEEPLLDLARLRRQDGSTPVRVKCASRGAPVCVASMSLASLLTVLQEAGEGGRTLLRFTLAGSGDSAPGGATFTALSCNGRQCSDSDGEARPGKAVLGQAVAGTEEPHGHAQPSENPEGQQCPPVDLGDPSCLTILDDLRNRTVPHFDLGDPSCLAILDDLYYKTVPDIDLGDPSCLAILDDPHYKIVPDPDLAILDDPHYKIVPDTDLGDPSCLACLNDPHYKIVPDIDLGDPSCLSLVNQLDNKTLPEVDLWDPSCLGFLGDLDKIVLHIEGDPPTSPQACETLPEVDLWDTSWLGFLGDLDKIVLHIEGDPPPTTQYLDV